MKTKIMKTSPKPALTNEEFLKRATESFGSQFDYSKTEYQNKRTKIKFYCSQHGELEQYPFNHLKLGCPFCSSGRDNTKSFIAKAKNKWDFDYSKVNYTAKKKHITFDCPEHGEIKQLPLDHLEFGCRKCAGKSTINSSHTESTVLNKIFEKHGNIYTYPNLNQTDKKIKVHEKIKIICPKHGEFEQQIWGHMSGQGCPKCGLAKQTEKRTISNEDFIKEATLIHNNQYDYSKTKYKNNKEKIIFVCPKHGEIQQNPRLHLRHGCTECNCSRIGKHTKETYIKLAKKIHGEEYDYSEIKEFKGMPFKIPIKCSKHGVFHQAAGNHIHLKNGCPQCAIEKDVSAGEKELVDFIKSETNTKIIENDREVLNGMEIDIYLPDLGLGIEYNGVYWHRESVYGKVKHKQKSGLAATKGVQLIHIYDYEWQEKKDIVKSIIRSKLGLSKRIFARKTILKKIPSVYSAEFLNENHIQGRDSSSVRYGLYHQDDLVAVMTFNKPRFSKKTDWEMVRYCSKKGVNVIGGAGKLLSAFQKEHSGTIVTFADKRYSNGNLYNKLGFKFEENTPNGYFYINLSSGKRYNRMKFQKHKLKNMDHYSEELSEYEIMLLNGYDRIWDCGNLRFVMEQHP